MITDIKPGITLSEMILLTVAAILPLAIFQYTREYDMLCKTSGKQCSHEVNESIKKKYRRQ